MIPAPASCGLPAAPTLKYATDIKFGEPLGSIVGPHSKNAYAKCAEDSYEVSW